MKADFIRRYYEARSYVWPTVEQAAWWIVTEVGEMAEALLIGGDNWVRNNPAKHNERLEEELADIIFMASVALLQMGFDPEAYPIERFEKRLEKVQAAGPPPKLDCIGCLTSAPLEVDPSSGRVVHIIGRKRPLCTRVRQ